MKKVIVIGSPGAGKSVFSRKLGSLTGIPVVHLDNIYWNEDKTHLENEEFDKKLSCVLKGDTWIVDGNYLRTMETRIMAADTVILLDYPLDICIDGAEKRVGQKRSDMPWFENELDPEFKKWIVYFHNNDIYEVRELVKKYEEIKRIIIFKTREESEEFLKKYTD